MELALLALLYFTTVTVPAPHTGAVVLPRVEQVTPEPASSLVVLSMDAKGLIYLGADLVTQADLMDQLSAIDAKDRATTRIFLRVHPTLDHSRAMKVMTQLNREGFTNIALVQGGNGAALEGSMILQKNED